MGCSKPDARSIRQAQKGRNDPHPPARKSFSHSHLQIIKGSMYFTHNCYGILRKRNPLSMSGAK